MTAGNIFFDAFYSSTIWVRARFNTLLWHHFSALFYLKLCRTRLLSYPSQSGATLSCGQNKVLSLSALSATFIPKIETVIANYKTSNLSTAIIVQHIIVQNQCKCHSQFTYIICHHTWDNSVTTQVLYYNNIMEILSTMYPTMYRWHNTSQYRFLDSFSVISDFESF